MKKIILFTLFALFVAGCAQKTSIEQIEEQISGSNNTNQQDLTFNKQENMNDTQSTASATPQPTDTAQDKTKTAAPAATSAKITTSKGVIEIKLKPELAPLTVKNFSEKAASGFYENLTFHRVEDWVIQGGDPLGTGTGGGKMPTELSDGSFTAGSVGVARGGDIKVSNDAQFFICTTDCTWLNGAYTYFGQVESGMEIVKAIQKGDKIVSISLK